MPARVAEAAQHSSHSRLHKTWFHLRWLICCVVVRRENTFLPFVGRQASAKCSVPLGIQTWLLLFPFLFAFQYRLVCQDLQARHPVPLRPITPDPATLCSQGAVCKVKRLEPLLWLQFTSIHSSSYKHCLHVLVFRGQGGITEGLVKGALSVAASAYKALFTGPNCSIQVHHTAQQNISATVMML